MFVDAMPVVSTVYRDGLVPIIEVTIGFEIDLVSVRRGDDSEDG